MFKTNNSFKANELSKIMKYFNEQGKFEKTPDQKPKINIGDSIIDGDQDQMNYVSPADYSMFRIAQKRNKDPQQRAKSFDQLLDKPTYDKSEGRIVAKRIFNEEDQRWRSHPIESREPPFDEDDDRSSENLDLPLSPQGALETMLTQ